MQQWYLLLKNLCKCLCLRV